MARAELPPRDAPLDPARTAILVIDAQAGIFHPGAAESQAPRWAMASFSMSSDEAFGVKAKSATAAATTQLKFDMCFNARSHALQKNSMS